MSAARWLPRVLAVLLFGWMVVLVAVAPAARNLRTSDETLRVGCASVLDAGWPWKGSPEWARDETGGPLTDSYGSGATVLPADETQQYIADRCQDLRTGRTGLAALLAVPTVLLALGRRGSPLPS